MIEYIIDGCNYIKFFNESRKNNFEARKSAFLSQLQSYAGGKKVKITVVFDSRRPSIENVGKLQVIHTPDADRRVVREVSSRKSPASVRVVSNDRSLVREIKEKHAKNMSVSDFGNLLEKHLSMGENTNSSSEKPSAEDMSEGEVRWWKKEFGLD